MVKKTKSKLAGEEPPQPASPTESGMDIPTPEASPNMQRPRIYLDQNILGYVRDGQINLAAVENVKWVYSNEHFNEIARGGDRSLLVVLENLRACQIELLLDEQFRITDQWTLHAYETPSARYDRHQITISEVPFDTSLFTDLSVRLFGGNNYEDVTTLPERLDVQLSHLLGQIGIDAAAPLLAMKERADQALQFFVTELKETRPIETIRKALVGAKNGPVTATENPIQEIADLIKARFPELDINQFLGLDPPDKQGYEKWPLYLGIIGCFTFLNMLGYKPDRGIRNAENFPNIMSDAAHIGHAAFCHAVMSEDKRFCAKAGAIYTYLNINTRVFQLQFQ